MGVGEGGRGCCKYFFPFSSFIIPIVVVVTTARGVILGVQHESEQSVVWDDVIHPP